MKPRWLFVVAMLCAALLQSCAAPNRISNTKKDISPYDFGLVEAKTGAERYSVLYETHRAAVAAGVNVDYSGIKSISIEIPDNPKQIPLTRHNDFKGCVFVVTNGAKNCRLFNYAAKEAPVSVGKRNIDAGDFHLVEPLRKGRYLLLIEDENPWVLNRKGHNYGHQRKDVLLVENGRAKNSVTMPYDNAYSKPKCTFVTLDNKPFVFKNITIERTRDCRFVANVAYISGADNVQISNVKIQTPANDLINDRGIMIYNCTNVTLDNVRIDGTYSQPDHSGYGFTLNNIWNLKVKRMYGKANWGVFGDNNINVTTIEDSKINRFDIHCYGRDISFKNVEFFDLYNQYASVFGTIRYDRCTFTNFVPVLNDGSYNAYVAHDVVFNDCVFNATPKKKFLVRMGNIKDVPNERNELAEKCLPNVRIKNLIVNMTDGVDSFCIFYDKLVNAGANSVGHIERIIIDGLTINACEENPVKQMMLSNIEIGTKTPVDCRMTNVVVNNVQTKSLLRSNNQSVKLKTNITVKGGKIQMNNVNGIKE